MLRTAAPLRKRGSVEPGSAWCSSLFVVAVAATCVIASACSDGGGDRADGGSDLGDELDSGTEPADAGSDAAIDAFEIGDAGISPERFAEIAAAAAQSSMVASAVAALLPEVASNDSVAPFLGLRPVPHGDVLDVARGVTDGDRDCGGATSERLDRCPAEIVCGDRVVVLSWGDGCDATSGRRISGFVRITRTPRDSGAIFRWDLAVVVRGENGTLDIVGSLAMRQSGADLIFDRADAPLTVRIPDGPGDRAGATRVSVSLDTITLQQEATGDYRVLGPDTYVITDVPISCSGDGGASTTISITVEDCGGWTWTVPLSSCICPVSGVLRATGPLLDPCGSPTSLQTLDVEFQPITATSGCGNNMTGWLYYSGSACAPSCGACDRGLCLGGLCTGAVNVSSVLSTMVGWVCTLPASVCGSAADAGFSCSDGGVIADASVADAGRDAGAIDAGRLDSGLDAGRSDAGTDGGRLDSDGGRRDLGGDRRDGGVDLPRDG